MTGAGTRRRCARRFARALDVESAARSSGVTNVRHIALRRARATNRCARADGGARRRRSLPEEFVLADLQEARAALEEITGRRDDRRSARAHLFDVLHRQVTDKRESCTETISKAVRRRQNVVLSSVDGFRPWMQLGVAETTPSASQ